MASCERFMDLICQSMDGPLALEDHQALQKHLEECPECRQLSQELSELQFELHSWQEQEVPEGFAEGVMNRIRAEEQKPKIVPIWKHPQFKMVGSVAACALICLGLWRGDSAQVTGDAAFPADIAAPAAETQNLYTVSAPSAAEPKNSEAKLAQVPAAETTLSATPSQPMQQADYAAAQFDDSSRVELKYAEQDLIQLVQNTLGEAPGTLLVVEQIPETLDGTWHTTENGTLLLVLDAQAEPELWKTSIDYALLYTELGEGPIVFVQNN